MFFKLLFGRLSYYLSGYELWLLVYQTESSSNWFPSKSKMNKCLRRSEKKNISKKRLKKIRIKQLVSKRVNLVSLVLGGLSKHTNIDESKHTNIGEIKHTNIDESKHTNIDESKHISTDESKHTNIDETKHTNIDEGKHTNIDEIKHTNMDESKHTNIDESKHININEIMILLISYYGLIMIKSRRWGFPSKQVIKLMKIPYILFCCFFHCFDVCNTFFTPRLSRKLALLTCKINMKSYFSSHASRLIKWINELVISVSFYHLL